jgi:hypothetical protein
MVVMPEHVVTVTEVLDGHVALDVQCLDRMITGLSASQA